MAAKFMLPANRAWCCTGQRLAVQWFRPVGARRLPRIPNIIITIIIIIVLLILITISIIIRCPLARNVSIDRPLGGLGERLALRGIILRYIGERARFLTCLACRRLSAGLVGCSQLNQFLGKKCPRPHVTRFYASYSICIVKCMKL